MALNALGLGILFTAKDMASGVMRNVEKAFSQTRNEMGQFQKANKSLMGEWGTGMKVFGAGVAGLAAFAPAAMAAADFEQSIANIRTVIDEASLSTDDAREKTMALAATYGGDAVTQANALYETISAGVTDASEAMDLLNTANRFAIGGSADMANSIDVLTSAVNVYREQGLSAAQASDIMFTAIAAGKTTAQQLSQSLGEVAPTAQAAGLSFAELNAAIATLTVQGIRTPQAVTGMNAMLSNMMKPSKDAADEAKRLGIEWDAAALKSKGFTGMLKQLNGNTKVNESTMVKLFGSIDGVKSALALTSNSGQKFDEVLGMMQKSTGATDAAFDIMSQTTKFQANRFMALGKNALILIGDAIQPLTGAILRFVNGVLEGFSKLPGTFINFASRALFVASAIGAIVGALTMLRTGFQLTALAARAFGMSAGGSILAAIWPAVVVIGLATAAFYGFKYALENNLGGIADRLEPVISQIKLGFEAISQLFSDGGFSGDVRDEFLKGGNSAINFAIQLYVLWNRADAFFQGMSDGFSDVMDVAGPVFDRLGNAIEHLMTSLGMASVDVNGNQKAWNEMADTGARVGTVLANIAVFLIDLATNVIDFAAGFIRGIDDAESPLGRFSDSIGQVADQLGNLMAALFASGDASEDTSGRWISAGSKAAGFFGGFVGTVAGVVSAVAGFIGGIASIVEGVIDILVGICNGDWDAVWAGFEKVVYGIYSAILEMMGGLVEAVASSVDALASLGGKDLGLGKKVAGYRQQLRVDLGKPAGLGDNGQPGSAVTPRPIGPPLPPGMAVPADSTAQQIAASRAQSSPAMDAAMREMAKPKPPPQWTFNGQLILDGETVQKIVAKGQADPDRNFTPSNMSQG
mgnify:CR=1 FL=1